MSVARGAFTTSNPAERGADGRRTAAACGPSAQSAVQHAAWLNRELLLLVWRLSVDESPIEVLVRRGQRSVPVDTRSLAFTGNVSAESPDGPWTAIIARIEDGLRLPEDPLRLTIRAGRVRASLSPLALETALTDLKTILRREFGGLDPANRARVIRFIASARELCREDAALSLSRQLFRVREALRERLPYCIVVPDEPQGLHVDSILAIDEASFWITGWARDADARIDRLCAVSPEGGCTELLEPAYWYSRPDVDEFYAEIGAVPGVERSGFISYLDLPGASRLSTGWIAELHNAAGDAVEVEAPAVVNDPSAVRETILGSLAHERKPGDELILNHACPALTRLQQRLARGISVEAVVEHGKQPPSPDVSIIVPLYGRIDFLEHQLAQFAHDPELAGSELIYVLDSPELSDALIDAAAQLYRLYRVPLRIAILQRNAGYSGANNAGAALARGQRLLLLNSDVLPDRPGWLGEMSEFYAATPGIGALGPKLLYEDDSLQHAGLFFERPDGSPVWENGHYFKGLHRSLPAANVTRPVPAVTGACLMIDRGLYESLGGLHGAYVQGDFEDSDLCLRLQAEGYENWYLPLVELYHLEGQSYPEPLRHFTYRYNSWLHTHRWGDFITSIMERHE